MEHVRNQLCPHSYCGMDKEGDMSEEITLFLFANCIHWLVIVIVIKCVVGVICICVGVTRPLVLTVFLSVCRATSVLGGDGINFHEIRGVVYLFQCG